MSTQALRGRVEHPLAIGSDRWFALFRGDELRMAKALVAAHTLTRVRQSDETGEHVYAVVFVGTDFWAAGEPSATPGSYKRMRALSAAWNRKVRESL